MASDYTLDGGRVGLDGASSITWQEVCDTSVVDWVKTNKAIIAATCYSESHSPASESFKLRWRNATDGGSFADLVTGSGELRAGASAGCITNTDPVGDECGCATYSVTDSEEVENETPLQTASLAATGKDTNIETQWCVDFSNALDGKEYEFELYSVTDGSSLGTLSCSVTTQSFGSLDTLLGVSWDNVDVFMGIEDTSIDEVMGVDTGE